MLPAQARYRKGAKLPPNLTGFLIQDQQLLIKPQLKDLRFVDTIMVHELQIEEDSTHNGRIERKTGVAAGSQSIYIPCTVPSRKGVP